MSHSYKRFSLYYRECLAGNFGIKSSYPLRVIGRGFFVFRVIAQTEERHRQKISSYLIALKKRQDKSIIIYLLIGCAPNVAHQMDMGIF